MSISKVEKEYITEWLWDWITDSFADECMNKGLLKRMSNSSCCLGWMMRNYQSCPHNIGDYPLSELTPLFIEAAERAAEDFDLWAYGELPQWL